MNKVYLSGIQEITKALKDGKVVFEEYPSNHTYRHRAIRLINGILISSYVGKTNNSIFMNDYICLNSEDTKFYYEEKEPVKLEVGKFYKTRDGEKVICVFKSTNEDDNRPYFFSSVGGDGPFSMWTTEDGFCSENAKEKFKNDVVDYWED